MCLVHPQVRSEKPYVDIYHREQDWVNAKGSTKVDTWEGAKYEYKAATGKGSEFKFNSGKRAFQVENKRRVDVNFPETAVVVDGGATLNVDQNVAVYGAGANETSTFATGNGPSFANAWTVDVGPTNTIGHGTLGRWVGCRPSCDHNLAGDGTKRHQHINHAKLGVSPN